MHENHSDCSRVAQHALVLDLVTMSSQPAHSSIQSDSTQESVKPKSASMAPRASAFKEQGFSEVVAA